MKESPVIIASRGSALALAQANLVLAQCRAAFPTLTFEIKIFKTTGDKLQTVSLTDSGKSLPKGLFTKELEVALLNREADFAVHSLKDLPTELPEGLKLTAVSEREDVRDVLIYSERKVGAKAGLGVKDLPPGACVGTSSTRRRMQLLALRPDLKVVEIRGNVGTRLRKLAEQPELHATILAAAGLKRLGFQILADGRLSSSDPAAIPAGIRATLLPLDEMLPCVGQAALGYESRVDDPRIDAVLAKLNDPATFASVGAERALLRSMGGGCLAPIAAHGEVKSGKVHVRAVWFPDERARRTEGNESVNGAELLGSRLAKELKAQ